MLIRLPWLISRRRLLVAVLIDLGIFSVLQNICFPSRYDGWSLLSSPIPFLLLLWLVNSYVCGRYYEYGDSQANGTLKYIIGSLLVMAITMSLYLFYNWLSASALGQPDSREILLPFMFQQSLVSGFAQLGFKKFLEARPAPPTTWLVVGDSNALNELQRAAGLSRLTCELEMVNSESLLLSASTKNIAGLVVNAVENLSPSLCELLLQLQAQGAKVLTNMGWCELVLQRFPATLLSNSDLVRGEFVLPESSLQLRLKRLGDVLVSFGLLLITAPLIFLAALLILVEDGGPIFYSQLRSGYRGMPYQVWKLRTMRVNAETSGAQWAPRNDPRITRVGRWLRITRIDELPQLLAVMNGKMSLIGPRPERPELEQELIQFVPHFCLRHGIRPGLSGWAQVNYPYGASVEDAANKLSYDLYYLRNFSIWLDFLILFKTIRLVFNANGAEPLQAEL
jgi:exopolysaccharide biosynthesis polyprenyl glycosylphosphotransferase